MREYDAADGLISRQGVNRHRTLIADLRGYIWYATNDGLSVADPARFEAAAPSVPLRASAVSVTRRRVVLSYTAVSLSVPERIRYRYHLDGFDAVERAVDRSVPAHQSRARYVFRVIASDGSGQWSDPSSRSPSTSSRSSGNHTISLRLLVLICAIWAGYRVHGAGVTTALLRFEERLVERNRIAQEPMTRSCRDF
jgi:hypothetical protein